VGTDETRQARTRNTPARGDMRYQAMRVGRFCFARLGLLPIQKAMRELRRHGMVPRSLRALEVFGFTGERMTRYYFDDVASLDVWEIEPRLEAVLRRNLPGAKVLITDSFAEIRRTDGIWDLVVIDNPVWPGEHFGLFPSIFRVLSDRSALVVRVLPEVSEVTRRRYPGVFDAEHERQRREFYATDSPERIPLPDLIEDYRQMARAHGHLCEWARVIHLREFDGKLFRRSGFSLLVMGLTRM
jgi:hypothetical protein